MRRNLVPIMFGCLVAVNTSAEAAEDCSGKVTDWIREPIATDAPAEHHRVKLECNLTLNRGDVVQKRLVLEGAAATGVTVNCNGATLDGGRGTKNDGRDMIDVRSLLHENTNRWLRPTDITIRNCDVIGSMRIQGMGPNGEAEPVRESSRRDADHVQRLRAAAPTRIILDDLTITATSRTPLYLAPGVTNVTLINSELKGNAIRTAIYLDAESAFNTIKNNYIHVEVFDEWGWTGINRLGPQISVDTSSSNRILNNRFSALEGGGIYTFRNCGEGGTVRHGSSSRNQIINNVFYYNVYNGENPSVFIGSRGQWWRSFLDIGYCDDDDGFPWGSSRSDDDDSRYNVVMQNQIYKLPLSKMIRQGDSSNRPNIIDYNQTVTTEEARPAGCYVPNGYKNFIRHGETLDVVSGANGLPACIDYRITCTDGVVTTLGSTDCRVQQVPFGCQVSGDNDGCRRQTACPAGTRIVAARAACNLEFGLVSGGQLASVRGNIIDVVRPSDDVSDGRCWVAGTSVRSGDTKIQSALDRRSVFVGCKEHDSNGGDCHIRGVLYCR